MKLSDFETAVNYLLALEKGLEENSNDRGGITNHGISLRFLKTVSPENLKKYGIFDQEVNEETIRNLTVPQAKAIYKGEFWDHQSYDKIANQDICNYVFSIGINIGPANAIKCLQRACWAAGKLFEQLTDDGILGNATFAAVQACGFYLMPALRAEIGAHYREIVTARHDQQVFLKGWLRRAYNS